MALRAACSGINTRLHAHTRNHVEGRVALVCEAVEVMDERKWGDGEKGGTN